MENQTLINTLHECVAQCNHCANACLDESDIKKMVKCIRLDRQCAAICQATAVALSADGKEMGPLLKLCADICEKCAAECRKHTAVHCQNCAEACLKCAATCETFQA